MKLSFETDQPISLESHMQRLALESEVLSNVIDTFRTGIPSLLSSIGSVFSSSNNDEQFTQDIKEASQKYRDLKPKLAHARIANYDKTLIQVPEGFKGNLSDYATTLLHVSDNIYKEANNVLGEYTALLSSFITNKDDKLSLKDYTDFYKKVGQKREQMNEEIARYFPERSDLSRQYLGTCVKRMEDVATLLDHSSKLADVRKRHTLKDISLSVKKATDLLQIIVDQSRKDGIDKISGASAMNISTGAYELGKYVEFISIYCFKVDQLIHTTNVLMKQLDEVL
jgi:hypothetical protein